jgi:hypothetical protein
MGYDDLRFWSYQALSDPFASPINLTGYGYGTYELGGSLGLEVVELVVGDDLETLAFYWNLRATRLSSIVAGDRKRRVLLAPSRLIKDRASLK